MLKYNEKLSFFALNYCSLLKSILYLQCSTMVVHYYWRAKELVINNKNLIQTNNTPDS